MQVCLRYSLSPSGKEAAILPTLYVVWLGAQWKGPGGNAVVPMLWYTKSMSALPIIVKQNSPSVGLFTH